MNATPSFGVSMISEVPSSPQLNLKRIAEIKKKISHNSKSDKRKQKFRAHTMEMGH